MTRQTILTIMSDDRPRTAADIGHALRHRGHDETPAAVSRELTAMVRDKLIRACNETRRGGVPAIYERVP